MHPYPRPFYIKLQAPHLPEDVPARLNSLASSVKSLQLLSFLGRIYNSLRSPPLQRAHATGGTTVIELPEAITLARQIRTELKGRQIASCVRGSSPHRFAFTGKHSNEEFAAIVPEKTIGAAEANGSVILINLEPGYVLSLGCGGERIIYHTSEKTLPTRHQLLLAFTDGTYLTVTVSGWGEVRLLEQSDVPHHPHLKPGVVSPLSDGFTVSYFTRLFGALPENTRVSAKYFLISDPGIWGVGNGCLQDILYRAKIHPRRQMATLSRKERRTLYDAITRTLNDMVDLGGRDEERDLYNKPGGYHRILHSKAVGRPCPECGTPIQKIQYLGGAAYFCPSCQIE
jgi:formamidopyrimidine-DNA glycosylase